jgi:hypothetical protein
MTRKSRVTLLKKQLDGPGLHCLCRRHWMDWLQ